MLDGRVRVVLPNAAAVQEYAGYVNERDADSRATATVIEGEHAVIWELMIELYAGAKSLRCVSNLPTASLTARRSPGRTTRMPRKPATPKSRFAIAGARSRRCLVHWGY